MLLEISNAHASYGSFEVLKGTSVVVREGEIVGVIGHNGVGKSTLLRTVVGVVPLTAGAIAYAGAPLAPDPAGLMGHGIGYVPEDRRIFGSLSVEENLRIPLFANDAATARLEREYARFPVLYKMRRRRAGDLSGGQQQMLAMARALVAAPRLLLLDEPTLGLAPVIVTSVFETLEGLRAEGVTTLLIEQNAKRTAELADRTYLMSPGGRIALEVRRDDAHAQAVLQTEFLRITGVKTQ